MQNVHVRFLKEFFCHEPYGKRELYKQRVQTAILKKLKILSDSDFCLNFNFHFIILALEERPPTHGAFNRNELLGILRASYNSAPSLSINTNTICHFKLH